MRAARQPASFELPLQIGMLACLALLSIFWVRLVEIGPFSLEAGHIGLLALILASLLSFRTPQSMFQVVIRCAPWLIAYLAYMIVMVPAVTGTSAFSLVVRQLMFIAGFACAAAYLSRARNPARIVRWGGLIGIVMYLAFTEYSAQLIGKSLLGAIAEFIGSGSFKALIFGFFRPVFNSLQSGTDLTFVASMTNSIAVSLLVLAIAARAGRAKPGLDLVGIAAILGVLFLAFILNARSVVIAAGLSMLMAFAVKVVAARSVSAVELFFWSLGLVGLAVLALVATMLGSSALDSIAEVFQFTDNSAGSRLEQYDWALALIEEQMLLGHGYVETDSGLPIHNLFLSSWAYTGLGGFLLVLMFYVSLVASWLVWLSRMISRPHNWKLGLRVEWVAVLPVLPLFRVWISGAGGLPAYGEWMAIGIFYGLVMRNEAMLRSPARLDELRVGQTLNPFRAMEPMN